MGDDTDHPRREFLAAAGGIAAAALAGCAETDEGDPELGFLPDGRTDRGDATDVGGGEARTFAARTEDGLAALGVHFGAAVLDGLPEDPPEGGGHHHTHLGLPDADTGAFEWVGLDWNPRGHEPPGVYDVPHLDVHFYTLEDDAVESIPGPAPARYDIPDEQMPAGYTRVPAVDTDDDGEPDAPMVVPAMGEHLMDTSKPEFHGEPFTHTHIWGAYDPALLDSESGDGTGQLIFMEPMVTTAFLEERREEVTASVGMPSAFPEAGRYPTAYAVRYHREADAYTVTFEEFERFDGSG